MGMPPGARRVGDTRREAALRSRFVCCFQRVLVVAEEQPCASVSSTCAQNKPGLIIWEHNRDLWTVTGNAREAAHDEDKCCRKAEECCRKAEAYLPRGMAATAGCCWKALTYGAERRT